MLPGPPFDPSDGDGYNRRRQHVIWYGAAVLVVLVAIIVLQMVT